MLEIKKNADAEPKKLYAYIHGTYNIEKKDYALYVCSV